MKAITINVVTNAMDILAAGSLNGNIYLFDNNRLGGSEREGTDALCCVLSGNIPENSNGNPVEYRIFWTVTNLCPCVYIEISDLQMSGDAFAVEKKYYEGTNISYWTGTVCKPFDTATCVLTIKVGTYAKQFTHSFTFKMKKEELA